MAERLGMDEVMVDITAEVEQRMMQGLAQRPVWHGHVYSAQVWLSSAHPTLTELDLLRSACVLHFENASHFRCWIRKTWRPAGSLCRG